MPPPPPPLRLTLLLSSRKRLRCLFRNMRGAAPAFIEHLTQALAAGEDVRAFLAELRERLAKGLPDDADAQTRDVARRFALVAAAGEMATAWGILPWPAGEATRAAESAMAAWLALRGGGGAAEDTEAVTRVRHFIGAHGEARFPEVLENTKENKLFMADTVRVTINRAGFRKKVAGGPAYLFLTDVWKGEVFAGADGTAGAKALNQAGFLLRGEGTKLQRKERVPGFDGPVRFYAVKAAIIEGEEGAA